MNRCYNAGNINVTNEIWSSAILIGGLIGQANGWNYVHPADIIINSYNTGNITANNKTRTDIAGLLKSNFSNKLILLNSYNSGNLNLESNISNSRVTGLIFSDSRNSQSTENSSNILNNVYNIGTVSGITTNKYGIGDFDSYTTNNIQNTYYENSVGGSNLDGVGTSMVINDMKQQAFVEKLNKNVDAINLEAIDASLKGYTLSKWQLGKDSYPTLINE